MNEDRKSKALEYLKHPGVTLCCYALLGVGAIAANIYRYDSPWAVNRVIGQGPILIAFGAFCTCIITSDFFPAITRLVCGISGIILLVLASLLW